MQTCGGCGREFTPVRFAEHMAIGCRRSTTAFVDFDPDESLYQDIDHEPILQRLAREKRLAKDLTGSTARSHNS